MTAKIMRALVGVLVGLPVVAATVGCGAAVTDTATPSAIASDDGSNPATRPTVTAPRNVHGVDLCDLLTPADVSKIAGMPARMTRIDESRCGYTFGADAAGVADPSAVSISIQQSAKIVVDPSIARTFELRGNTAVRQVPRRDECQLAVFTSGWDRSNQPYGEGLNLTLSGFGPATLDRCALGLRMLTVMFDRLPL